MILLLLHVINYILLKKIWYFLYGAYTLYCMYVTTGLENNTKQKNVYKYNLNKTKAFVDDSLFFFVK
jgi:hypothetical protein